MKDQDNVWMEHIMTLLGALGADEDCLTAQELQTAREISRFLDEMPGGFLIYRADGAEEILHANSGLLRIFQCDTMEEFLAYTGGTFRGLVYPEDIEEVEAAIWSQIAASQFDLDYVEYRILRRDGDRKSVV